MSHRRLRRFVLPALVALALALRFGVIAEWHVPAGDGIGYHQLAHELRTNHHYAYSPTGKPTYARMPGWPVVIAALDPGRPNDIETVLVRAAVLNVLLDLVTALLLFAIAREASLGPLAEYVALGLGLLWPLFILNSCYLLRETLSTTIATAIFYFIARAWFRRDARMLVAASLVIGLGMLVRFDMLALGLACVPVWWALDLGLGRKLRTAGAAVVVCAIAFSPWPIRNMITFGHAYPARELWNDSRGDPMPMGEREWVSTWVDALDQGWLNLRLVQHMPVTERDVHPHCCDTPTERAEVMAIFARYNKEGLSPAVDQSFHDLAMRRFRERPFLRLVYLPILRAGMWWWHFPPAWDQPLRSRLLFQPQGRVVFERLSNLAMIFGLVGWFLLLRRRQTRAFAAGVAIAVTLRTLAMTIIAPDGGGQRYVSPTYPLFLLGIVYLAAFAVERWRSRSPAPR